MGRFITRFSNLIELVSEQGLGGLWKRIATWAWRTREYVFLNKSLSNEISDVESEEVYFQISRDDDIPWLCQNMQHLGENAEKIIRQQFVGKDVTIVGRSKENPELMAFSAWLSNGDFAFNLLKNVVSPGDVSIRRVWVPPAMRKKGLATFGMRYAEFAASRNNVRKIWSFVETDNINSLKLHDKLGYSTLGRIKMIKRFGRSSAKVKFNSGIKWQSYAVPSDRTKL